MNFVTKLVILVCILAGASVGYFIGAWKVDGLQTRLDNLKIAGEKSRGEVDETKKAIEQALALKEQEYLKEKSELKKKYELKQQKLNASLSSSESRIAVLNAEKTKTIERLASVRRQLLSAKGQTREDLRKQEEKLRNQTNSLSDQTDGLACLNKKVPGSELSNLKRDEG